MHVSHEEIQGELISLDGGEIVVFIPDGQPYGKERLTIKKPETIIAGQSDGDCIVVFGYVESHIRNPKTNNRLWERGEWTFYPTARPE